MGRHWLIIQHFVGALNAFTFIQNVAGGSYLFAAVSLGCVFLTASWKV